MIKALILLLSSLYVLNAFSQGGRYPSKFPDHIYPPEDAKHYVEFTWVRGFSYPDGYQIDVKYGAGPFTVYVDVSYSGIGGFCDFTKTSGPGEYSIFISYWELAESGCYYFDRYANLYFHLVNRYGNQTNFGVEDSTHLERMNPLGFDYKLKIKQSALPKDKISHSPYWEYVKTIQSRTAGNTSSTDYYPRATYRDLIKAEISLLTDDKHGLFKLSKLNGWDFLVLGDAALTGFGVSLIGYGSLHGLDNYVNLSIAKYGSRFAFVGFTGAVILAIAPALLSSGESVDNSVMKNPYMFFKLAPTVQQRLWAKSRIREKLLEFQKGLRDLAIQHATKNLINPSIRDTLGDLSDKHQETAYFLYEDEITGKEQPAAVTYRWKREGDTIKTSEAHLYFGCSESPTVQKYIRLRDLDRAEFAVDQKGHVLKAKPANFVSVSGFECDPPEMKVTVGNLPESQDYYDRQQVKRGYGYTKTRLGIMVTMGDKTVGASGHMLKKFFEKTGK